MSEFELKRKGDEAVRNFKERFKGLALEDEMKKKWADMALMSTQKKLALARQNNLRRF